jgi:hypothetical protein
MAVSGVRTNLKKIANSWFQSGQIHQKLLGQKSQIFNILGTPLVGIIRGPEEPWIKKYLLQHGGRNKMASGNAPNEQGCRGSRGPDLNLIIYQVDL